MSSWSSFLRFVGLLGGLAVWFAVAPAVQAKGTPAQPKEESYLLNDVGATVFLPGEWKMTRWSDWDFRAATERPGAMLFIEMTPNQADITEEAAKAFADSYVAKMTENKDVKIVRTGVEQVGGRPTAVTEISFAFPKGGNALMKTMAFQGAGKVIHVKVEYLSTYAKVAESGLRFVVEKMVLNKPAYDLEEFRAEIKNKATFTVTPASGWRRFTPEEQTKAEEVAYRTGNDSIDYEKCMLVTRPMPLTDPDVVLFCNIAWHLPPVDEHSWKGVEGEVYAKFFKSGQVPHAEKITRPDRLGFFYMPQAGAGTYMAVIPYDGGIVVGWAVGAKEHADATKAAFNEMIQGMKFNGPNNGAQLVGAAGWIMYGIKYRTFHPFVIGPIVLILGILGSAIWWIFLRRPKVVVTY